MKKAVLVILLLISGIVLYQFFNRTGEPITTTFIKSETQTPKETSTYQREIVSIDSYDYYLYYQDISNMKLTVVPNFEQQISASSIAEQYECKIAVSGGFYTQEDTPLGLFKVNGNVVSKNIERSNLLGGYYLYENVPQHTLSSTLDNSYETIIQAGPYYERTTPFSSADLQMARRIVLVEDENGSVYITSLTAAESSHDGPQLETIPDIVFSPQAPFNATKALNLDGGTASYYKGADDTELLELTHAGSILCFK
jgi:hypothetical protein